MGRLTRKYNEFKASIKVFTKTRDEVSVSLGSLDQAISEIERQMTALGRGFETFIAQDPTPAQINAESAKIGKPLAAMEKMKAEYEARVAAAKQRQQNAYGEVARHILEIGQLMAEKAKANDFDVNNPKYIKIKNKIVAFHQNTAPKRL